MQSLPGVQAGNYIKHGCHMQACHGSLERAGDWLFSHADDLDSAVASVSGTAAQPAAGTSSQGVCDA